MQGWIRRTDPDVIHVREDCNTRRQLDRTNIRIVEVADRDEPLCGVCESLMTSDEMFRFRGARNEIPEVKRWE